MDEHPLQVLPSLAVEVGLNEAIILQQIHYWTDERRNQGAIHDGQRWVYNTYSQWRENFPFWSERTIRRILNTMEESSLIFSTDKYNVNSTDRTKWYTINYDHPIWCDCANGQIDMDKLAASGHGQVGHLDMDKLATSTSSIDYIPETTAEITPETITESAFDQFWDAYPRKVAKKAAQQAWSREKITDSDIPGILSALETQKRSRQWTDKGGQFIPHPATWINNRRWEDEVVLGNSSNALVSSAAPEWLWRMANGDEK